jgi:TolB protein
MAGDGSAPKALTDHTAVPRREYWPSASPDGSKIAFSTYRFGGWKLGVMENSKVKQLTDFGRYSGRLYEGSPNWSPNGHYVAFFQYHHRQGLYIMDMNAGKSRRLRTERRYYDFLFPTFAPDSNNILYADRTSGNYNIVKTNITTGSVEKLTSNDYDELAPSLSPDGSKVALFSNETGRHQLYVMNTDGSEKHQLTSSDDHVQIYDIEDDHSWYISAPSWSADGTALLHSASYGGNIDIYLTSIKDGASTRLTTQPGMDIHASWIVRNDR